jgi:hypothetical protein
MYRLVGFVAGIHALALGGAKGPPEPVYSPPKGYVCCRANPALTIDGRLDDAAWGHAPWTDDFVDIEGDRRPKPRFRTRAKMLWDDQFFYLAAELEEPHIWGTLTQRDSVIFHDNDFEVFIDPDGDSHAYFEFEMNVLNTEWDLFLPKPYKNGGKPLDSWDIAGLRTAVHLEGTLNDPSDTDRRWTLEIAMPWKVLCQQHRIPRPPSHGDHWRVNFSRVEWQVDIREGKYVKKPDTKEDNWVWSPQGVIDMHRPERWGYVQFSTAPPGKVHFSPDLSEPVRHLLHRVYYAQRRFREREKHYARTLAELGLVELERSPLIQSIKLESTESGFEATAEARSGELKLRRWHIRDDGRIWPDRDEKGPP